MMKKKTNKELQAHRKINDEDLLLTIQSNKFVHLTKEGSTFLPAKHGAGFGLLHAHTSHQTFSFHPLILIWGSVQSGSVKRVICAYTQQTHLPRT